MIDGQVESLTDSSQMEGISIYSQGLTDFLDRNKVFEIRKRFSRAIAADTIYWDSIRQKWHILPDLTRHYAIQYDSSISIDSILSDLLTVNNISNIGRYEMELIDSVCINDSIYPWVPNDPSDRWHLQENQYSPGHWGTNTECAWGLLKDGQRGAITIAISDLGVDINHPDLIDKYICGCGDTGVYSGQPGHGTGVAGLAVATANNGIGVVGSAPDALFISYNFKDDTWKDDDLYNAITDGADVINCSWHINEFTEFDTGIYNALEVAYAYSIPVVVSTGDYGPYTSYPSLWDSLCISVGAYGLYGTVTSNISNYGCPDCDPPIPNLVDIVAPGYSLFTTAYGGDSGTFSGTSAAAPVVAGIVALAKSYNYSLTPERIEEMLEQTADNTNLTSDSIPKYGAGRVDAYEFIQEVINTSEKNEFFSMSTSLTDSIPCLIITDIEFLSHFNILADKKIARGTNTKVIATTSTEIFGYSGEDLAAKIRACIKDYHENYHTEYVILGGDGSIIPYRYAYNYLYGPGVNLISDSYYSCLDGNWNFDGDSLYGEVQDSVDLVSEVYVGRLPFSTELEVVNFILKLENYESGDSLNWQDKALFCGSEMFQYADGKRLSQHLKGLFPTNFNITEQYDDTGGTASLSNFVQAMNSGQGLVVKHGMAWRGVTESTQNFFLKKHDGWSYVTPNDIDTLSSTTPSVIYSVTCWNNELDKDCLSKHYMSHPTGGAVAYIGTTYNDYVLRSNDISTEFFTQLFGNGPKEIGKLLDLGKQTIMNKTYFDGGRRHTVMGYTLLGDPQMRIWTATPKFITQNHTQSVTANQIVTIKDTVLDQTTGLPIEDAVVCLKKNNDVYEVKKTDANGEVIFIINFATSGGAVLTAGKDGYVYASSTVTVGSPPSGCPMLYTWDGTEYKFENNILPQSEDNSSGIGNKTDYYPIFNSYQENSKEYKFLISEDENEISSFDKMELYTVDIPTTNEVIINNMRSVGSVSGRILPVKAITSDGEDIINLITEKDGQSFKVNQPGYLELEYQFKPNITKSLAGSGGGGIEPPPPGKGIGKVAVQDGNTSNLIAIFSKNSQGSYELVDKIHPRIKDIKKLSELKEYINSKGLLSIKLEWSNHIDIDYLPYVEYEKVDVTLKKANLLTALHSYSGDISDALSISNDNFAQLIPGQQIELTFEATPKPQSVQRILVFKAVGKYETLDPLNPTNSGSNSDSLVVTQNFPNPFNPTTEISFNIPKSSDVIVEIFNVLGQKVITLLDNNLSAGSHVVTWDSKDRSGSDVSSGIYFYRIQVGDSFKTKKMLLLK